MSNKKFFSLIYGDQIVLAPETKIIPAGSLSTLMESEDLIKEIHKDATKYKEEVAKESEKIKEQAFQEGYEEGFKMWAEQLLKLEEEIDKVHGEVQAMALPVALRAAKKIVGRELELHPEAIIDIVIENIKAVSQHKKITIYVNRKDLDLVEKNRSQLKQMFEVLESFSIRERSDVKPGGCIIETEMGIINAQLEHRWTVLEKVFEKLNKTSLPKKDS